MTKKKRPQFTNVKDNFDFSKLIINKEECSICGNVIISNSLSIYKEFMKQIRGRDINPRQGFLRYIKDIVNREILTKYRIYGEPLIIIDSEDEEKIEVTVEAVTYPEMSSLKFDLNTLEVEKFSDRDYDSYLSNIKQQVKIEEDSNDTINIGDKITVNCTLEGSTDEQELIVSESLQENLKNALINKKRGDHFEYKFEISSIREHIKRNPQYKEYKDFFKKNTNIISNIEIKRVIKFRQANNDIELMEALKLKSQEELTSKIKVTMEKEFEELNYAFCRHQILEQIKNNCKFNMPKKLVDNYELAALEEFSQNLTEENILRHEEFKKKCRAKVVEKLLIHFCIDQVRLQMGISEEQIRQSIIKFYGAKFDTNKSEYKELRKLIIMNSYIKSISKSNILKQTDLTDARNTVNSLHNLSAKEHSVDDVFLDI